MPCMSLNKFNGFVARSQVLRRPSSHRARKTLSAFSDCGEVGQQSKLMTFDRAWCGRNILEDERTLAKGR